MNELTERLEGMTKKLTITAEVEKLDEVLGFLDSFLEESNCDIKTQMQLDVALEEMFVNVAHYAYAPEKGDVCIEVENTTDPEGVIVTLTDSGIPYDPLAKEDPDVTLSAADRQIGGLGIFMVKKSMDEVFYERKDGKNIFRMRKNFIS